MNMEFIWDFINSPAGTSISTFILAIITFFLAITSYLQVKASNKQINESRLQKRIENHNSDLKALINGWYKSLPKPPLTGFEIYEFISYFEDNPLFSDLENHLPSKYSELMEEWYSYEKLSQEYCDKQNEIIKKIKILIEKEELDYNPILIFFKTIELLTSVEHYHLRKEEKSSPDWLSLYYSTRFGEGKPLILDKYEFLKEEANTIDKKFKELYINAKNNYENDIYYLLEIEHEMKLSYEILKEELSILSMYPEYNNMTCEFIISK